MTAESALFVILIFIAGWPLVAVSIAVVFERVLDWINARRNGRGDQ